MNGSWIQRFSAVVDGRPRGGITFRIPFEPSAVWGDLDGYYIQGSAGGMPFRGRLTETDGSWSMQLGPTWCRAPGFGPGDEVEIVISPEGPRTSTMGGDVTAAFAADPAAARFFDSLPTFYRNNFLRWIDDAKQPATRSRRIAEVVDLAAQGRRER